MSQAQMNNSNFDIVIIGGGMVGASLACALLPAIKNYDLKVALIESYPFPQGDAETLFQPSYDDRSTALSYGSRCLLQQLGVWQKLSERVTPIEHIHVSDKGRFGSVRLHASEHGIDALGYVVENAWLGRVLLQKVLESEAIECISPAKVAEVKQVAGEKGETCQQVLLEQGGEQRSLTTRLAIVADGGRSAVCHQLGLDAHKTDYQQYAIVANVSADRPHGNVAYERFTPEGPVALLPLHEPQASLQNRSALVFTAAADRIVALMEQDEEAFLQTLQLRFGYRIGQFTTLGKRESYPLMLQRIKEQVRPGLAVIGNAAHTLHPVAGQGFNLALRGLMTLAETLNDAAATGENPGDFKRLQAYFNTHQGDQDKTIAFTDQLLKVFGSDSAMVKKLRGRGLLALEFFNPAKQLFARQAMGLGDTLPRMAGGDHS